MKRLLIVFIGVALVSLAGCSKPSAYDIYERSAKKLSGSESYKTQAVIDITYDIKGETPQTIQQMSNLSLIYDSSDEKPLIFSENDLTITDSQSTLEKTIKEWFSNDRLYVDDGSLKYYEKLAEAKIPTRTLRQVSEEEVELISDSDDGYTLSVKADLDEWASLIAVSLSGQSEFDIEIELLNDTELTLLTDAQFEPLKMSLDVQGSAAFKNTPCTFEGTIEIVFSKVEDDMIPSFDPDTFEEIDKISADALVLGEYDLCEDDIEVLKTLDYSLEEGAIYTNGVYYVDLENKQFYGEGYVYDWQYDAAFDYDLNCYKYFTDGSIEGEGCDVSLLEGIKAAYRKLAQEVQAQVD